MTLVIQHQQQENKGSFIAQTEEGNIAGEMTYSKAGSDKIIIDHTEVGDAYGGQGVGKLMFLAAVEFARKEKVKIMPLCPFAASMFKKDDSFQDVLF